MTARTTMKQPNNHKAFTLIELLVTIALLGILAGGIVMVLDIGGTFNKASLTKVKKFSASIENSLSLSQVGKWSTFFGQVDEVAIYKEALTLSQIQKLYAQGMIKRALALK